MFLKISQISQENKPKACNFIKKGIPTWVFSCEICENFINTIFSGTRPMAASESSAIYIDYYLD